MINQTSQSSPCPPQIANPREGVLCERIAKILDDGPTAVNRRLDELEREWTTGRLVKASAGVCLIVGLIMSQYFSHWWIILPAIAGLILIQYLFFRRSWLADLYKMCGVRSGAEIEDERIALRILRGDFKYLPTIAQIEDRESISRMEGEGGPAIEHDDEMYDSRAAAKVIVSITTDPRH